MPAAGSILILDGGLGTTLEDVFHQDVSTPLWSAKPIEEDPEVIISAHLAFLHSGADIILTSTYQCAYNTFERSGFSHDDARRIMLKSVRLALEAKQRFLREVDACNDSSRSCDVKIALSLGSYGATLSPAQEFDGFYPPPFGPDVAFSLNRTNVFEGTEAGLNAMERTATEALTAFHYERLGVFAEDKETWDAVDFIAFETVPLRREIIAIRRAVTRLHEIKGVGLKPWWISTVFPDGHYPEMKPDGGKTRTVDVATAVLLNEEEAVPLGFGINCTGIDCLTRLLEDVQDVARRSSEIYSRRPWLVLYPNRGDVYDTQTKTWQTNGRKGSHWAEDLCAIVAEVAKSEVWDGIIVGGCCKTGPTEIAELSSRCNALSWKR